MISLFTEILLFEPIVPPCITLHSKNLSVSLIIFTTTLLKSIDNISFIFRFLKIFSGTRVIFLLISLLLFIFIVLFVMSFFVPPANFDVLICAPSLSKHIGVLEYFHKSDNLRKFINISMREINFQ